jgi:thiol:disulfide interchange protein DsbD
MVFMHRMLICFFLVCFFCSQNSFSQDSSAFDWKVTSKKISANEYELQFLVNGANGWQLYAPNQVLSEVVTTELKFSDSSIQLVDAFKDSGNIQTVQSSIFEGDLVRLYEDASAWRQLIKINGPVPASLQGVLLFTYGREDEFYPATSFNFSVSLEGGVSSTARIKISSINVKNPVNDRLR